MRSPRLERCTKGGYGGTVFVCQPLVRKGGSGGVVPVGTGPVRDGLLKPRTRLALVEALLAAGTLARR